MLQVLLGNESYQSLNSRQTGGSFIFFIINKMCFVAIKVFSMNTKIIEIVYVF